MPELHEHRLKRLTMRSMRRGIKEMDLILSAYAKAHLTQMSQGELDLYDSLLNENDQDLYAWITGQHAPPRAFRDLVTAISAVFQK